METHSLYDLNNYISQAIALNFQEAIWVRCEISQVGKSRGHYYLDLIEKEEGSDELIAQAKANLWKGTYAMLKKKNGLSIDSVLSTGMEVLIQVVVRFHERYGLSLQIEDVDPSYTMGKLEAERRIKLEKLQSEGLVGKNEELDLPVVLQRIAIISSERAAGYKDFVQHLSSNVYGYDYKMTLYDTRVQGVAAEKDLIKVLKSIKSRKKDFDCVVIIRGGGAKTDLALFDGLDLCRAIAKLPLPVITGIGHEIDDTLSDFVAHTSVKTPTAAADFLIAHNMNFESDILTMMEEIKTYASHRISEEQMQLDSAIQMIEMSSANRLEREMDDIERVEALLPEISFRIVEQKRAFVEKMEAMVNLLNPTEILKRGYSISYKKGKLITAAAQLKSGDEILTHFHDGKATSIVNKVRNGEK